MSETATHDSSALRDMTTAITAAYVSHHHIPASAVPALITTVHGALAGLISRPAAKSADDTPEKPTAAEIRRSITPDALISFVDGKPYKTLKRHLSKFGLEPHSYRERFGLPSDYPMTSPNYSATRSALAQQIGLGQRVPPESSELAAAKPKRRGQRFSAE